MSGLVQTTPLTSQQILVLRFYESSAWKVSKYEVFFLGGSVFSCIQFEYREIRTRKNPQGYDQKSVFGYFSRSAHVKDNRLQRLMLCLRNLEQ